MTAFFGKTPKSQEILKISKIPVTNFFNLIKKYNHYSETRAVWGGATPRPTVWWHTFVPLLTESPLPMLFPLY